MFDGGALQCLVLLAHLLRCAARVEVIRHKEEE